MTHRLGLKTRTREAVFRTRATRLRSLLGQLDNGSDQVLDQVGALWGNPSAAGSDYLREIWLRCSRPGPPVLECGSGLSTVVAATAVAKSGRLLVTLEHDPGWHRRTRRRLRSLGIDGSGIVMAPLVDYGSFDWYSLADVPLPDEFGLVICDGPPSVTRGGRYGLYQAMGFRLAGATILLDDLNRSAEQSIVERWATEFEVDVAVCTPPTSRPYAVVSPRKRA